LGRLNAHDVFSRRQSKEAKLAKVICGDWNTDVFKRDATTRTIHTVSSFYNGKWHRITEFIGDPAGDCARSRKRNIDVLDVMACGYGDYCSGLQGVALAELERHEACFRRCYNVITM
jgi:hypothetical protein